MPAYIIFLLLINDSRGASKLPCTLGVMQSAAEPYLAGLRQFLEGKMMPEDYHLTTDVKVCAE